MDIDMDALEQALSSKRGYGDKSPSIDPFASNEDLLNEAIRLAKDVDYITGSLLRIQYQREKFWVDRYGALYRDATGRVKDANAAPRKALERLISRGRSRLKYYYEAIEKVTKEVPTLTLEANLEGEQSRNVLHYIEKKMTSEVSKIINGSITAPSGVRMQIYITVAFPNGRATIGGYLGGDFGFTGIEFVPRSNRGGFEIDKTLSFIKSFEQVKVQLIQHLDQITVKRRS